MNFSLDLAHFTPVASLTGGLLIGAAAVLLVLGNGRVAGISGIVGGLLNAVRGERAWRAAFIAGLVAAPWLWRLAAPLPAPVIESTPVTLIAAGLLVGVGTRYGSGCTSGHGVCGLSRGSLRSLVATSSFMAAGFVTVFVVRHLIGG
ncbi:MAG: YeeE/YedE family protein [Paraburkholderia sp.]|uniref:YeeE/YedE family protein n=1 Tax=Paraburkholderia sp. TaxID=1926495 RepID=UPI0012246F87|nr:YeeE/YedE family protein [Paraburkholderia sp.]TAM07948.1 MAG: YeeE/YedE family protein [Paraburkholderia sp.]TAM31814.1 MAG: YeeE/YedE family protein [Paraburkholderia sp.]